ncbi:MAG: hypothetical protein ACK5ZJ_03965 [Acidobacteriota bacterium]
MDLLACFDYLDGRFHDGFDNGGRERRSGESEGGEGDCSGLIVAEVIVLIVIAICGHFVSQDAVLDGIIEIFIGGNIADAIEHEKNSVHIAYRVRK